MKLYYLLMCMLFAIVAKAQEQGGIHLPPDAYNQKCQVTQWIGPVEISITYHSPDIHGRSGKEERKGNIWGKVVKYGFEEKSFFTGSGIPWRAGANENTIITVSHDLKIQGKLLKAGTYGLFLAAAKEGPWTWIFSNVSTGWGSFNYDDSKDALRVETTPQDAPYTEWLTYGFDDRQESSATAYLQWDEKRIPFKVEVENLPMLYVDLMRKDLAGYPGFKPENYVTAANFCLDNNINLEEGLKWVDKSILWKEDFRALQTKSELLFAMGKPDEAKQVMDKALNLPSTSVQQINTYGRVLLSKGEKEKAMEIFLFNSKRFPQEKFITSTGLARGYTAIGDKKNAIKSWELAIKNIPEDQKKNLPMYEAEVKKLKEGA